ncbi:MAG: nucleotidyltransferase domain-containing protein, partial [Deltaproteobacteria bacterium]|nr:nucleotidyltransferase domain-containing protein [Deltaproteobacteria bacterium]
MQMMQLNQQEKSSSSVKVRYLNASEIIVSLKSIAVHILDMNKNVSGVYLFGSLSKNNYSAGSDADILIVLKKDKRRVIDRIPEFLRCFLDVPISIDIFPYTEDEIQEMIVNDNRFASQLWNEKKILAVRN